MSDGQYLVCCLNFIKKGTLVRAAYEEKGVKRA